MKNTKYIKLTEQLRNDIKNCAPGSAFYTVREIMSKFDSSQATVTKSLDILSNEGLIETLPGSGIRITDKATLLKERKFTICIAMPRWPSLSFQESEVKFYEIAEQAGFIPETVFFDWRNSVPQKLPDIKIDAMLLITSATEDSLPDQIERLDSFDIPYVFVDKKINNCNADCVFCDGIDSGTIAADYLIKNGHRKLAIIVTEPMTTHIEDKIKGFSKYAQLQHAEIEILAPSIQSGELAHEKVYKYLKEYLGKGRPAFTAAFTVSNEPTVAVYKAFYESGLKIGPDISLISSGDNKMNEYMHPALSSISESLSENIITGVEILLKRLKEKSRAYHRQVVSVPPKLIIRDSVRSLN